MNIESIFQYFTFGYSGDINNLIYLFLFLRFAIFPFAKWLYNKIRGLIK